MFGEVLPNDLRLKARWNKSRRARADGHQFLHENNFSIYKQRGHNGGRRPAVNIPSVRDINRAANRQRVQNNAEAVARKREAKQILSQKCVDTLERAWRQPTLSGRFGCVYKPGDKEKTVCYTSLIHTRLTHHVSREEPHGQKYAALCVETSECDQKPLQCILAPLHKVCKQI